ncbi:MAG: 30S ribosomal protein S9 [Candidatus Collierbacteria bacterium GW2011_GWD2_42_50]|nr:MAG: 30S ribosomal protein S9 [Candidatus Collierbacteria bacterium GW2011_GWD2_42_50]
MIFSPFVVADVSGQYTGSIKVSGSGIMGQAEAIMHGIGRALMKADPEKFKKLMRDGGFLTRDPRMKRVAVHVPRNSLQNVKTFYLFTKTLVFRGFLYEKFFPIKKPSCKGGQSFKFSYSTTVGMPTRSRTPISCPKLRIARSSGAVASIKVAR